MRPQSTHTKQRQRIARKLHSEPTHSTQQWFLNRGHLPRSGPALYSIARDAARTPTRDGSPLSWRSDLIESTFFRVRSPTTKHPLRRNILYDETSFFVPRLLHSRFVVSVTHTSSLILFIPHTCDVVLNSLGCVLFGLSLTRRVSFRLVHTLLTCFLESTSGTTI